MGPLRGGDDLHVEQLVKEQRALRRVATLVAEGAAAEDVFAAVAEEVAEVLRVPHVSILCYESDGTATERVRFSPEGTMVEVGTRWQLDGTNVVAQVLESAQPARIDDYSGLIGEIAETVRGAGIRSTVGSPIVVAARLWGAMVVSSLEPHVLPPGTEARLAEFTELVATALANSEAGDEIRRLADEQAALRRVATLVARGMAPEPVLHAVADEAAALLGCDAAAIVRFEGDGTATVVGAHKARRRPGTRFEPDPASILVAVRATGDAHRFDTSDPAAADMPEAVREEGVRSALASPIVVDGALWGAITVASLERALAARTEHRLADFTELVATAISNAQAREDLGRLATEQAALRRVATLVAREASQTEVFTAIAGETGQLLGTEDIRMYRYEDDHSAVVVGAWGFDDFLPVGSRHPLGGRNSASVVFRTRRPARIDDYATTASGSIGDTARTSGIRSVVATPILVQGRLWGAIAVGTGRAAHLPPDTEYRLGQFTELMATAIANAQAREDLHRLAAEQAALRHVATLVAREASQAEVFTAIAEESGRLLGAEVTRMLRYEDDRAAVVVACWGLGDVLPTGSRVSLEDQGVTSRVFRTGRPARADQVTLTGPDGEMARSAGIRRVVGTPIVVEGRHWGAMTTGTTQEEPLPPDTESRLGQFTELMASAIANTESHARAERLTEEQATLRRLATLVAKESPLEEVFANVAEEVANTLGDVDCVLWSDGRDGTATAVATRTAVAVRTAGVAAGAHVGMRLVLDEESVTAMVLRDGRPHRIGDYSSLKGSIADRAAELGIRAAVGCPIVVGGRTWGAMMVATYEAGSFGPGTEVRVARFSDLVATAIANAEARAEVERLADEQAALRRVATLVAESAAPGAVLDAVAAEMQALLNADQVALNRFEAGEEILVLAHRGLDAARTPVGTRVSHAGENVTATVRRTGRPARMDDYEKTGGPLAELARATGLRSSVSAPIVVEGEPWGLITASWKGDQAPPADTEERVTKFADLVGTAIANMEARAEVERLAAEQASLRRVATLVGEGAEPAAVFDAVSAEMEALLGADQVSLARYEPGDEVTVVAHRGSGARRLPPGSRLSLVGQSVTATVRRTEAPARLEDFQRADGPIAAVVRAMGMRVSVGAPLVVDGRLWGVITARWTREESPPAETEQRMARFAELLDTAIANADSRDQLTASRARLLTAGDDARRRVVRDLHDGAQQRLVHTIIALELAHTAVLKEDGEAGELVGEALEHAKQANAELRELAHGLLPGVLINGGLHAALGTVVARMDLPVDVDVPRDRFPAEIEASAYFIAAEALTNVVKHAQAGCAAVSASVEDGTLRLEIRDDGIGGADAGGHGLVGLRDRVTALGGRLEIESPPGSGTLLAAALPLPAG